MLQLAAMSHRKERYNSTTQSDSVLHAGVNGDGAAGAPFQRAQGVAPWEQLHHGKEGF